MYLEHAYAQEPIVGVFCFQGLCWLVGWFSFPIKTDPTYSFSFIPPSSKNPP